MASKFELNDLEPAAPAGRVNVQWQYDSSGNVSAHVATAGAAQTPWVQNVDADNFILQDLLEVEFRNASGSNGFAYITADHNQIYAGSQNNGLVWHVTTNTKAFTVYGPLTTEAGPVWAQTVGFKFPDGSIQATAAVGGSQTPWTSDIDGASHDLNNAGQINCCTQAP